jgi:hypothetical protein
MTTEEEAMQRRFLFNVAAMVVTSGLLGAALGALVVSDRRRGARIGAVTGAGVPLVAYAGLSLVAQH